MLTSHSCAYGKEGSLDTERGSASSNQAMAIGNGDATEGITAPCDGHVKVITGSCENCASGVNEIDIELRINGVSQSCDTGQITGANELGSQITACNVAFSAGDQLNCYTKTETGAVTGLRCHLAWQYD